MFTANIEYYDIQYAAERTTNVKTDEANKGELPI